MTLSEFLVKAKDLKIGESTSTYHCFCIHNFEKLVTALEIAIKGLKAKDKILSRYRMGYGSPSIKDIDDSMNALPQLNELFSGGDQT